MICLEDHFAQTLGDLGEVDGHDVGSGEMNIFVLTSTPNRAFTVLTALPPMTPFMMDLKAAYRDLEASDDRYVTLHPTGTTCFSVT